MGMVEALRNFAMFFVGLIASYYIGFVAAWTLGFWPPLVIGGAAFWVATKLSWGNGLALGILAGGILGAGMGAMFGQGTFI